MNKKQSPIIKTKRLILRPYTLEDARELQKLIGDYAIADTTATVPHPYEDGMAEEYIGSRQEAFETGKGIHFAIAHREQGYFMGGISLRTD